MKRVALVLLAIALVVSLSSCAKQAGSGKIVGVSLLTKSHPFYQALEKAMQEEAAKQNITLTIQSAENNLASQNSQVDNFITQKVDAIIVCPVDTKSIVGAIGRANAAKIPVFTADISAGGGDVVCHVASDNVAGGRLAGEYMVKQLKGKGEVVIVDFPSVTSVADRTKGFMEAISKSGIKVVGRPNAQGQRKMAMDAMDTMLQAHPNVKGVFGINDDSALGALESLNHANRKDIVVIGYDGGPEARKNILAGSMLKADAVQYPEEIGKATIKAVADHLAGKSVPKTLPVKVGLIDKESLSAEKKQ